MSDRSNSILHRSAIIAIGTSLAFIPMSRPAQAHPHEFVTMQMTAQFDGQSRMTGLTYTWTFDEFFTAYAVEGQDANKNGKAEPKELDALLKEILGNIEGIQYFTVFDKRLSVPQFAAAQPLSSTLENRQLRVRFNVPFSKPMNLQGKKARFAIYDDQFYIAMNYDPDQKAIQVDGGKSQCKSEIERPDPDEELAAFASSLGKEESSGGGLGAQFAEWVSVACK